MVIVRPKPAALRQAEPPHLIEVARIACRGGLRNESAPIVVARQSREVVRALDDVATQFEFRGAGFDTRAKDFGEFARSGLGRDHLPERCPD